MAHATIRVQLHIGDPVYEKPPVTRAKLETIFKDIQSDLRYDHELNGYLNCGNCTATCPAAHYYDFSPCEIVQLHLESARSVLRPPSCLGRGQVNAGARHPGGPSVRGEGECERLRRMCLRTPRTALVSAI